MFIDSSGVIISNTTCIQKPSKQRKYYGEGSYIVRGAARKYMKSNVVHKRKQQRQCYHTYSYTNGHLIPAINTWADRAKYTTARPISTQFPGHGCMNDLTTERSLDSQATWVIDELGLLTCCQLVFIEPRNGRRPVDWCKE